jgi:predicted dienelactone hydrolase
MSSQTAPGPERASAVLSVTPLVLATPVRGVDLSLRISAPATGDALSIILFSHGNGQSLHAYGPLADYWAAHGLVIIQPTHLDSRTLRLPPNDPASEEAVATVRAQPSREGRIETK